jgi:hypothetical protein
LIHQRTEAAAPNAAPHIVSWMARRRERAISFRFPEVQPLDSEMVLFTPGTDLVRRRHKGFRRLPWAARTETQRNREMWPPANL